MTDHEMNLDKIKIQHKSILDTQRQYVTTLEGDSILKDKHIQALKLETERLRKDIDLLSELSEKRLDR